MRQVSIKYTLGRVFGGLVVFDGVVAHSVNTTFKNSKLAKNV